jgi:hypothetical protein
LICETRDDKAKYLEGKFRRGLRTRQNEESKRLKESIAEANDAQLDAMLSQESI